jgi:putative oxidoreductase
MKATLAARAQNAARSVTKTLSPVVPLVARLTDGTVIVQSGWGKLHHLDKVIAFFTDLGIPVPALQAPFVSTVALVGRLLVLAGFGSRIALLLLLATMVVVILTAKRAELMGVTDLFGIVELTYLVLLGGVAAAGPSRLSVEGILTARSSLCSDTIDCCPDWLCPLSDIWACGRTADAKRNIRMRSAR